MKQSRYLFYVHTVNSFLSKWCPWELGYFDALSSPEERVYVMPLVEDRTMPFGGQEYLGLYRLVQVYDPLTANERKEDIQFVRGPP